MQTFAYGAVFEPGEKAGIVVSFPDVPEAITQGDDMADAMVQAEDALGLILLTYLERDLPLPLPRAAARYRGRKLISVAVTPEIAAKLALVTAFRESGLSKADLARRLGKDEKEVRRILDPRHATKLPQLRATLQIFGKRLVISVADAA
jgi:antitoxin HicB